MIIIISFFDIFSSIMSLSRAASVQEPSVTRQTSVRTTDLEQNRKFMVIFISKMIFRHNLLKTCFEVILIERISTVARLARLVWKR